MIHPVAPSEAMDVLYRAMRPTSYRRIRMAIKIVSNLPAFFYCRQFVARNHS